MNALKTLTFTVYVVYTSSYLFVFNRFGSIAREFSCSFVRNATQPEPLGQASPLTRRECVYAISILQSVYCTVCMFVFCVFFGLVAFYFSFVGAILRERAQRFVTQGETPSPRPLKRRTKCTVDINVRRMYWFGL